MKHIDKTAIAILTEEFYDYPRNDWHYDREYKMLVKMKQAVYQKLAGVLEGPIEIKTGLQVFEVSERHYFK